MLYHLETAKSVENLLNTSITHGLDENEANSRLTKFGYNKLPEEKRESQLVKLLKQFKDVLVLILIGAALISYFVGEHTDAYVILAIVIINGIMGYAQEAQAERAIEALKKLSQYEAKVIRKNPLTGLKEVFKVVTENLVPGDLVVIETGDKIPADGRVVEAINLEISEAILTGESNSVKKADQVLTNPDLNLGDRLNMVYKDTTVVYGRGVFIVTDTGKFTEIGKISALLQTKTNETTPLQNELDSVGKMLSFSALGIIAAIFAFSIFTQQMSFKDTFITSISLAVAAIPEGLPAIITIVLAIGVSRLAKAHAIIRKLQAVETLGSTNYILTDKTGTLTQNKMTATHVTTEQDSYEIIDEGLKNAKDGSFLNPGKDFKLAKLIEACVLCNDTQVTQADGSQKLIGDPTETALIDFTQKMRIDPVELKNTYERIYEIPFSSESKKMLVVVKNIENQHEIYVFAKGAAEIIGTMVTAQDHVVKALSDSLAKKGLRNLAFSFKQISNDQLEQALNLPNPQDILSTYHTFIGIISQQDPVRPQAKLAIYMAKQAGIQTLMLTGDHKLTAENIAWDLGLIDSPDQVIDGIELDNKGIDELKELLKKIKVFARVSPIQKLHIVQAVKAMGNITAVTGDGINDAPAIKAADIGIAMGISGTDVTKEVSDMILQDDNYATIVEAIRQGRIVYDNLVKFIKYLVSCNISEIIVIAVALMFGLPSPLLPIHILWINLVTDGIPALALGMEPGEKDVMVRKPRNIKESLLTSGRWNRIIVESLIISAISLGVYVYTLQFSLQVAQVATLMALSFCQLIHALNNRSETHSIFSRKLDVNWNLWGTLALTFGLQIAVLYTPIGNNLLKTLPLDPKILLSILGVSLFTLVANELIKVYLKMSRTYKT